MAALSTSRASTLDQLRQDLARRFPGSVEQSASATAGLKPGSSLLEAPVAWVEVEIGVGGLAWLAAWTLLHVAHDPRGRPALWVDTHGTYTPGDLLDLQGKLVIVRPEDPHEAHVAADLALRAGSFSIVALEMHRALHPKPLARLARLARAHAGGEPGAVRTPLVLWGVAPAFVAPPSGVPRTSFAEATAALVGALAGETQHASDASFIRALHTTDRLRPMDRAPDRRPPPANRAEGGSARADVDPSGGGVDERTGGRPHTGPPREYPIRTG
jgi:hypothetical protein